MPNDFVLSQALTSFGLLDSPTMREQLNVMVEALHIFQLRDYQHRGVWAEQDLEDAGHHVRSKAVRLFNVTSRMGPGDPDPNELAVLLDSAIDGINYNTFVIRHARGAK